MNLANRWLRVLGAALTLWGTAYGAQAWAQGDFLTDLLLNEQQERQLAEQEHPKVLAQFGGEYDDPELSRYVSSVAAFLGQTSGRPDIRYRVTILNSPIVNAFALPAGYLYVTRGLLALADSEAELAGVLAHEIGHVTARHTAQRYSRAILAEGLAGLLGTMTQGTQYAGLADAFQPAALAYIQSFSRENENEADLLGVATMSRAGFDPFAMSSFLSKLEAKDALEARLAGQSPAGQGFDLFATHPRTADRVAQTVAQASSTKVRDPIVEPGIYLSKIDDILYGDDPAQGFVRGRLFAHPGLGLRFEVPEGFHILNGQKDVVAKGPGGETIRFDSAPREGNTALDYLTRVWLQGAPLNEVQTFDVNGFPAATGTFKLAGQGGESDVRLVSIQAQDAICRFLYAAPGAVTPAFSEASRQTTYSFRRLTEQERQSLRPYRLVVRQVRQGETLASLAASLPFADHQEERFRVLNGIEPWDKGVKPGQMVKLVVEN